MNIICMNKFLILKEVKNIFIGAFICLPFYLFVSIPHLLFKYFYRKICPFILNCFDKIEIFYIEKFIKTKNK